MENFKIITTQKYGRVSYSLTNQERGVYSPVVTVKYPNFFIDKIDSGACCAGTVNFIEDFELNKTIVVFYPNNRCGFTTESLGHLNKFLNYLQKNYKLFKDEKTN